MQVGLMVFPPTLGGGGGGAGRRLEPWRTAFELWFCRVASAPLVAELPARSTIWALFRWALVASSLDELIPLGCFNLPPMPLPHLFGTLPARCASRFLPRAWQVVRRFLIGLLAPAPGLLRNIEAPPNRGILCCTLPATYRSIMRARAASTTTFSSCASLVDQEVPHGGRMFQTSILGPWPKTIGASLSVGLCAFTIHSGA